MWFGACLLQPHNEVLAFPHGFYRVLQRDVSAPDALLHAGHMHKGPVDLMEASQPSLGGGVVTQAIGVAAINGDIVGHSV